MDDIERLVELWHGDLDSFGYFSEKIVFALCERTAPVAPTNVAELLYPGEKYDQLPYEAVRVIDRGWKLWRSWKNEEIAAKSGKWPTHAQI